MATRTIKMVDGTKFSGTDSNFTDYDGFIKYGGLFGWTIIYQDMVIYDTTRMSLVEFFHQVSTNLIEFFHQVATNLIEFFRKVMIGIIAITLVWLIVVWGNGSFASFNNSPLTKKSARVEERTLQRLFEQSYIDPLTRYIHKHKQDKAREPYVLRVENERQKRCASIEKKVRLWQKNRTNLAKLKSRYNYSCPNVVSKFARSLMNG